jgi:hypothetical protein
MLYKNVKVSEIHPVVYLKSKAIKNHKKNEFYVLERVSELGLNDFEVENPIDDLVFIYFREDWSKETALLSSVYNKLNNVFEEVKINLHLDEFIENIGNTVDLSLDEFLEELIK